MTKVYSLAFILMLIAHGQAIAQNVSDKWTIQDIVNRSILGVSQKYAEFKIGSPAITEKTDSLGIQRNLYEVGQCYVTLGIRNSEVVSVRMYAYKDKCDLDLSDDIFFGRPGTMLTDTTFEDWARLGTLHFVTPGLPSCNACGETDIDVYGLVDAVGVTGMVEVQVGGNGFGNNAARKGYDIWREMLRRAGIDGDKLPTSGSDCPLRQFDRQAYQLMKDFKVSSIGYGRPNTLQPACSAVTDQQYRSTGDFIK